MLCIPFLCIKLNLNIPKILEFYSWKAFDKNTGNYHGCDISSIYYKVYTNAVFCLPYLHAFERYFYFIFADVRYLSNYRVYCPWLFIGAVWIHISLPLFYWVNFLYMSPLHQVYLLYTFSLFRVSFYRFKRWYICAHFPSYIYYSLS